MEATNRTAVLRKLALAALLVASIGAAQAQNYPNRPIHLIVPLPAGGGVDTSARIIA